jgi:hypothetical protein
LTVCPSILAACFSQTQCKRCMTAEVGGKHRLGFYRPTWHFIAGLPELEWVHSDRVHERFSPTLEQTVTMTRIRAVGKMILIVSLLAAVCGSVSRQRPSLPSVGVPAASTGPSSKKGEPAFASVEEPAVASAEQPAEHDFEQVSDLSTLNSYRVHYTFSWESSRDGQKESGFWDIWGQFVRQPPARRLVWTGTGTAGRKQELTQVGQDLYMNSGSDWVAMTSSHTDIFMDNPLLVSPLNVMFGTRGMLVRNKVMVNGTSANQYVLDESALKAAPGLGAVAKAEAEVWISPEFNVVVRYVAHYEAENLAFGGGQEGTLDLAFDLMDINQPISITAPEGVKPAVAEDIPIAEGAGDLNAFSGMIAYNSTRSVEQIMAFYEAQMPARGWTRSAGLIPNSMGFAKDGRTAQITIQAADGRTAVTIISGE